MPKHLVKFLAWAVPVIFIPVFLYGVSIETRFTAQAAQETTTQQTLREIKASVIRIEGFLMGGR